MFKSKLKSRLLRGNSHTVNLKNNSGLNFSYYKDLKKNPKNSVTRDVTCGLNSKFPRAARCVPAVRGDLFYFQQANIYHPRYLNHHWWAEGSTVSLQ